MFVCRFTGDSATESQRRRARKKFAIRTNCWQLNGEAVKEHRAAVEPAMNGNNGENNCHDSTVDWQPAATATMRGDNGQYLLLNGTLSGTRDYRFAFAQNVYCHRMTSIRRDNHCVSRAGAGRSGPGLLSQPDKAPLRRRSSGRQTLSAEIDRSRPK